MDAAWVTVRVKDVNDNPPLFSRPHAHVSVREDAVRGTLLATLSAQDPDAVRVESREKEGLQALGIGADGTPVI